jgi:hypothetical protein
MANPKPTVRIKVLLVGLMLAFFGYVGWSTLRINQLESKLARVEASTYALGRYTYDLGSAVIQTNTYAGMTGKQLADFLLESMKEDDVLKPIVYSSRNRTMFIQNKHSPHNQLWALSP